MPPPEGQEQNQNQSQKEIILIVAEGCPHCEEVKKTLPDSSKGKIKVLDVTKSLEAASLMRDLGVFKVPLLVTVERTEQGTEVCTLDEKGVKCVKSKPSAEETPS
jgi:glutaredoxin